MTNEINIGKPNEECAGCRTAFGSSNSHNAAVRIALPITPMIFFEYRICGKCLAALKTGGIDSDSVIAGINAFHDGVEVKQ